MSLGSRGTQRHPVSLETKRERFQGWNSPTKRAPSSTPCQTEVKGIQMHSFADLKTSSGSAHLYGLRTEGQNQDQPHDGRYIETKCGSSGSFVQGTSHVTRIDHRFSRIRLISGRVRETIVAVTTVPLRSTVAPPVWSCALVWCSDPIGRSVDRSVGWSVALQSDDPALAWVPKGDRSTPQKARPCREEVQTQVAENAVESVLLLCAVPIDAQKKDVALNQPGDTRRFHPRPWQTRTVPHEPHSSPKKFDGNRTRSCM